MILRMALANHGDLKMTRLIPAGQALSPAFAVERLEVYSPGPSQGRVPA
jgi:hypothetical protein